MAQPWNVRVVEGHIEHDYRAQPDALTVAICECGWESAPLQGTNSTLAWADHVWQMMNEGARSWLPGDGPDDPEDPED